FLFPCRSSLGGALPRRICALENRRGSSLRGASNRHLYMSCYRSSKTKVWLGYPHLLQEICFLIWRETHSPGMAAGNIYLVSSSSPRMGPRRTEAIGPFQMPRNESLLRWWSTTYCEPGDRTLACMSTTTRPMSRVRSSG